MEYRIGDMVYPTDIDFIQKIIKYELNIDLEDFVGIVVDTDTWKEQFIVLWVNRNRTGKIVFDHISVNNWYWFNELTDARKEYLDIVHDAHIGMDE